MDREHITMLLKETIEEVNLLLDQSKQISDNPDAPLFGHRSQLDSLSFVDFIVQVEQKIESKTQKTIILADEKAFSRKNSPFKNINSLQEYIYELLNSPQ